MRRTIVVMAVAGMLVASGEAVRAQTRSGGKAALWTAVGAGAGFGLGLFLGLNAFDDAINSDRKVWTSAIAGAAAGGTLGYFIGRSQRQTASPSTRPSASRLSDREVLRLAKTVRLDTLRGRSVAVVQSPDAYSATGQF